MNRSLPVWIIDGNRHRRIFELLGIVWMLSMADLFFTLWAHRFAPFYEVNPIARVMLRDGAIGSLVLFKVLTTMFATAIFWHIRRLLRTELALWAMVGVYTMLSIQWFHFTHGAIVLAAK